MIWGYPYFWKHPFVTLGPFPMRRKTSKSFKSFPRIAVQREEFTHFPTFLHVDFGDGFPGQKRLLEFLTTHSEKKTRDEGSSSKSSGCYTAKESHTTFPWKSKMSDECRLVNLRVSQGVSNFGPTHQVDFETHPNHWPLKGRNDLSAFYQMTTPLSQQNEVMD